MKTMCRLLVLLCMAAVGSMGIVACGPAQPLQENKPVPTKKVEKAAPGAEAKTGVKQVEAPKAAEPMKPMAPMTGTKTKEEPTTPAM